MSQEPRLITICSACRREVVDSEWIAHLRGCPGPPHEHEWEKVFDRADVAQYECACGATMETIFEQDGLRRTTFEPWKES